MNVHVCAMAIFLFSCVSMHHMLLSPQANKKGGSTIPWGKPSGDDVKDGSALVEAWEKAMKIAGWP